MIINSYEYDEIKSGLTKDMDLQSDVNPDIEKSDTILTLKTV